MEIILNGETRQLPDDFSAAQLVNLLNLKDQRMAMEINQEIVPRSTFNDTIIHPGDQIEIVGAIGGG